MTLIVAIGYVTRTTPKVITHPEEVEHLINIGFIEETDDGVIKPRTINKSRYCAYCCKQAKHVDLDVIHNCDKLGELHFCSTECVEKYEAKKEEVGVKKIADVRARDIYRAIYEDHLL
jgi:hypothetical protein